MLPCDMLPISLDQMLSAHCRGGETHYTPNTGTSAIRNAIAKKLREENGISYSDDEIVVSNGAKQCIFQAIMALVAPCDEVWLLNPF